MIWTLFQSRCWLQIPNCHPQNPYKTPRLQKTHKKWWCWSDSCRHGGGRGELRGLMFENAHVIHMCSHAIHRLRPSPITNGFQKGQKGQKKDSKKTPRQTQKRPKKISNVILGESDVSLFFFSPSSPLLFLFFFSSPSIHGVRDGRLSPRIGYLYSAKA